MKLFLALLITCQTAFASTGFIGPALVEGVTLTATAAGTTTLTKASETVQVFTGSTTQTSVLPNATTLPIGRSFEFYNLSTGTVTVNANGGSLVRTLASSDHAKIVLTNNSTSAGTWAVEKITISLSDSLLTGTLSISKGGTGQTTANAALNALLPTQTLNSGKFLTTDGTNSSWADAGLSTQGIQEASATTTTLLKVPSNQLTNIGTGARLLETGNGNILGDPSFERTSGSSPWSAITWDGALSSGVDTTPNNAHGDTLQSYKIVANADYSIAFLRQDVTLKGSYAGQLMEHGMYFKTTNLNLMQICARQNGARVGICMPYINLTGDWEYQYTTSFATSSTTSLGIELAGTGNMTGTGYADDAYVGPDRNSGSIRGEYKLGSIEFTGCSSNWTTTATSMSNFAAVSGCTITTKGLVLSPGSNIPGFKLNSIEAGTIRMEATSQFFRAAVAASTAVFRFSDGTNSTNNQGVPLGTTVDSGVPAILGSIDYSSAQTSPTTIQIQGFTNAASNAAGVGNGLHIDVYFIPNYATTVRSTNSMRSPTYDTLISGSGTYIVPLGASRLEIEMIGGGGGGGGGGSGSPTTGGTGGNTTFGTSLLTANGAVGPAGGTATIGTGATGVALTGVNGQGTAIYTSGSGLYPFGGMGASTPFGGGGPGGEANGTGVAAITNTGAGGGGGSTNGTANVYSGKGGGAGGYIKAQIDNPVASYTYAVGAGGSAGSAGTNGLAGGAGGSGVIRIKVIYGVNVPPMKAGVIAADNPGGVTTINTKVIKNTDYTATVNEDKIIFNHTSGTKTLSLPPAASVPGKEYLAIETDPNVATIIDPNASELICGQSTVRLIGKDKMRFFSDGTNWQSEDCNRHIWAQVTSICSTNPCTIAAQKGGAFSTIVWSSTGSYNPQFVTGAFSSAPACKIQTHYLSSGSYRNAIITTGPTTGGVVFATFITSSAANENSGFTIDCEGPR